jgi:hypothetical protein
MRAINMPVLLKENRKLLSHFPPGKKQLYFDVELSVVFKRPVLDLVKFEGLMHQVYGEYEEQGLSLYDLLVKEKGEVFAKFVEGFI